MFDDVLKHRSGRVIALARMVLAAIFLAAIWIDPNQPAQAATATYGMLGAYVAAAAAICVVTWNNWWLDAKLAAPAHIVDIAMFTLLVLTTDGYTSPFFVFFVFMILSAAIRWGWRETAQTAVAVILLYFIAGFAGANSTAPNFDLQRFIIRSGNLVILSALLIWFGINHGFSALTPPKDGLLDSLSPEESPLESAVEGAARLTGASRAVLIWKGAARRQHRVVRFVDGEISTTLLVSSAVKIPTRSFLFDARRNRALCRGPHRRMEFSRSSALLAPEIAADFEIDEGLAVAIRTDAGGGLLLLGGIKALCTDYIEFGESLGAALSAHIQSHALLAAVEEGAGARARLSLARDLHDSIVQFLAGATFRIEAIKRSLTSGEQPERELQDLKELMLQEQQELRTAIGALRTNSLDLPELAADIRDLCSHLGRPWDIACRFSADGPNVTASTRLHLDTHQLIREAVANAVRHAGAKSVDVRLTADDNDLRLDINNDGSGSGRLEKGKPWSLHERVDEANGTLMLASHETGTSVSITLPLSSEIRP